ncbi:MAG: hypothetical protein AB7V42_03370 [Thermoleophilia bacterium]
MVTARILRGRLWCAVLAAAAGLGAGAFASQARAGVEIVYLPADAADAAYDAGLTGALRQMPADTTSNPRWPADRRIGKVSVSKTKLTTKTAAQIVRIVQAELRKPENGGQVAIDELNPNQWSAAQAAQLDRAWIMLGPDAQRVSVYASPALVEQVGRSDPRLRLATKQLRLFDVAVRSGATYLQMYRGGWVPLPAEDMAGHVTRWLARWPEAEAGRLRLLIGPGMGLSQEELWNRVRATPAGRTLLGNGVGLVGGTRMSPAEAREWVRQYIGYQEAPQASPPGGDIEPPRVGPPVITAPAKLRAGGRFQVAANRAGKAVVQLLPIKRGRPLRGRAISKLVFPTEGTLAAVLPRDARSGRYRILVTFWGSGIKERATLDLRIVAAPRRAR